MRRQVISGPAQRRKAAGYSRLCTKTGFATANMLNRRAGFAGAPRIAPAASNATGAERNRGCIMPFATLAGPVFHLHPMGRLANLMIEYMVALRFADLVPGCRISNISIPEWGIDHPPLDSFGPAVVEEREQHIDIPALAEQMRSGRIARVNWIGFGQRMENFLPAARYQDVFRTPFSQKLGYGPEYLVCPIRAEDILHAPHPDYVLTPVEFYRDIVELTGLQPVFIGQTQPNPYMDRIRATFPNAIVRPHDPDPLIEFETIRQSRNLVIGVSTFNWLAAWLSRSDTTIYLAVSGLYNPMQKRDVDLLPFGDPRYRFFLFPINYAVDVQHHAEAHRRLAPYWRQMSHAALRRQFSEAPRFPRDIEQALSVFDEDYYLTINADVAAVAQQHGRSFARSHFTHHGISEGRSALRFDPVWYAAEYPLAAFEVAQGDYAGFEHHYAAIGRARGYRPYPPGA
jgi:hypothetical protein